MESLNDKSRASSYNHMDTLLQAGQHDVKHCMPRYLTDAQKLTIVHVHMAFLRDRNMARKKQKRRPKRRQESLVNITARVTGVSHNTVELAWKDYREGRLTLLEDDLPENQREDLTSRTAAARQASQRVRSAFQGQDTQSLLMTMREFARERRQLHQECTAKHMTNHLVEEKLLPAPKNDKAWDSLKRAVRRLLVAAGWKHDKRKGHHTMFETAKLRAARVTYLDRVLHNRHVAKLREFYTDESYINHHYHKHHNWYDPTDNLDLQEKKEQTKGDRYCFVGGVLGPNLQVEEANRTEADMAQWFSPAYMKFHAPVGQSKKVKKNKDYHQCFDAAVLEKWFEETCKSLQEHGHRCLIIMDNVAYHKAVQLKALTKLPKAELFRTLKEQTPDDPTFWDEFKHKTQLVAYLESLEGLLEPTTAHIAAKYGHEILFTPPYHSDLQPIELVWAVAKGQVSKAYHNEVTMEEVLACLDKAFAEMKNHTVQGCYNTVLKYEEKFRELERDTEALDEADLVPNQQAEAQPVQQVAAAPASAASSASAAAEMAAYAAEQQHRAEIVRQHSMSAALTAAAAVASVIQQGGAQSPST